MKLKRVDKPEDFWDVNMANPESLAILHKQTGYADDPQRVLFRDWLRLADCRTMLDCGAGPGWEFDALRDDSIDIHYTALEVTNLFLGKLAAKGIHTIKASVEDIPRPDNSFDLVYCRQVLEHVGDFRKALHEMIRVARFFVYIAMNKDFGVKTVIHKQHGLWHNVYARDELTRAAAVDKVHEVCSLNLKSYLITMGWA